MIYWALWQQRRVLQTCSLTWEMCCDFLNPFGREKKRERVVRNRKEADKSILRAFLKDEKNKKKEPGREGRVNKKSSILRPWRGVQTTRSAFHMCHFLLASAGGAWHGMLASGAQGLSDWHKRLCTGQTQAQMRPHTYTYTTFPMQTSVIQRSERMHLS